MLWIRLGSDRAFRLEGLWLDRRSGVRGNRQAEAGVHATTNLVPDDPAAIQLVDLVHAARQGDEASWNSIVDRFSGLVWAVVRAHQLGPADSSEVVQTTWLRLVEHLDQIRDGDRLGGWLATTARNECLRQIQRRAREVPGDMLAFETSDDSPLDRNLLVAERDLVIWRAFGALSERCQQLLRSLLVDSPPSYQELSEAFGIPIGAIGPTRRRCLDRLRQDLQSTDFGQEEIQ
jgi:RNA polymerase sigma factor (sigma-70 family)